MKEPPTVIHVVDDDPAFRSAIRNLLHASGYEVALYESGDEFLKQSPASTPGCVVLDVNMSGLSGLQLQERLVELNAVLPIVFLTGHGDIPISVKAIKSGAEDFLTKPVSKVTLLEAIERALKRYADRRELEDHLAHLRQLVSELTPREREVYNQVVRGKLNKQIAHDLGISERTVKAHRHTIMEKLRIRSVAEAASIAERLGLLMANAPDASKSD